MEQTLALIKPEAFENNLHLEILDIIEQNDFKIKEMLMTRLTEEEAAEFLYCHKGKPFYDDYVKHMSSGRIIALKLEKENAVKGWRELIGNTNPELAKEGTIRKKFAKNMNRNMIHGADSIENAKKEIKFFFGKDRKR